MFWRSLCPGSGTTYGVSLDDGRLGIAWFPLDRMRFHPLAIRPVIRARDTYDRPV